MRAVSQSLRRAPFCHINQASRRTFFVQASARQTPTHHSRRTGIENIPAFSLSPSSSSTLHYFKTPTWSHNRSSRVSKGALPSTNQYITTTMAPSPTNTFTITTSDGDVPVHLPSSELSESQVLAFKPFTRWLSQLSRSLSLQHSDPQHAFHADPYRLVSITVKSHVVFGSSRIGFLLINADVRNNNSLESSSSSSSSSSLPGSVFLRGPSVAMLVMLIPSDADRARMARDRDYDEDQRHVLLTVQPRVAAGSLGFVELPAGMVDDSGTFAGAAAKEIEEELGMRIPEAELVCLSSTDDDEDGNSGGLPSLLLQKQGETAEAEAETETDENLPAAMYPSAGGCDEYVPVFAHERVVPRETLDGWTGKLTGLRDQGEKITLKLVPMSELWREGARDGKALAALALWQGRRRREMARRREGSL